MNCCNSCVFNFHLATVWQRIFFSHSFSSFQPVVCGLINKYYNHVLLRFSMCFFLLFIYNFVYRFRRPKAIMSIIPLYFIVNCVLFISAHYHSHFVLLFFCTDLLFYLLFVDVPKFKVFRGKFSSIHNLFLWGSDFLMCERHLIWFNRMYLCALI